MTDNIYRVVLTGNLAEGKSESEVKTRMAALFKTSPEKIAVLLNRGKTVIKKDINLATAKKYAGAILATGALCKIDPPETPADDPPDQMVEIVSPAEAVTPEEDSGRAEPRVVVIPLSQKPEDRFEPKVLENVSGIAGGINLNMPSVSAVNYADILALAAFSDNSGGTRLYVFVNGVEHPFVCNIDHIAFDDFPIKVFPKSIASFRGFLHFLCKKNPSIILEETTLDFLSGSQPQELDSQKAMKLATGMGQLIESGDIDSQT